MLARISFKGFILGAVLAAGLADRAAGQVGYFYPPYQTWPPGSPGVYPGGVPPIFQPWQLGSPYGSGSLFLFSPGYLPSYGSVLIQPGYPGPYAYGYPFYGSYPYQYYRYYNWYYSPPGPYLWRWHGRNDGQRRFEDQPGPTEVRPREGAQRWNQQEPIANRQPRGSPTMSGAGTRMN